MSQLNLSVTDNVFADPSAVDELAGEDQALHPREGAKNMRRPW